MSKEHKALFVIGSSDPHYDTTKLLELEVATGGESLIFEGADHSLEIPGKPLESLAILQNYVKKLENCLVTI
ncbi:MAG: hypothetical protein ACRCYY_17535 [Trueperaceae bacterium]